MPERCDGHNWRAQRRSVRAPALRRRTNSSERFSPLDGCTAPTPRSSASPNVWLGRPRSPAKRTRGVGPAAGSRGSGDTGRRYEIEVRQATCARTSGQLRAAAAHLGRARRSAPPGDLIVQCELLIEQAWIAVWSDRWDRALGLAIIASRDAIAANEPALQFHAWTLIGESRSAKGLPDADAADHEALRAAHASGDERLVGLAEGNLALIADNRGRWKQAVSGYSRSGRAFRRCGDVVNVAAVDNQATILVELGDVETAYALAVDAARVFAAAGDSEGPPSQPA